MPEEKIVFVNSEPAKSGCQMEFSVAAATTPTCST